MLTQEQKAIDVKAALLTVVIHILLLLFFFFITYRVPRFEPVAEMGIEVNIGTSADGYGADQPLAIDAPAPDNEAGAVSSSTAASDLPPDMLHSNDADAPAVNNTATTRPNTNNERPTNINRRNNNNRPANDNNTQRQQARYVYGGNNGPGGNSAATDAPGGSEGNTTGNGDRGVPGGTPGADNYEGTPGSGGGISHTLSGRNIVAFPPREAEFNESGRVTIRVTVNRQGIVTDQRIVSASNAQLREIALKKISSIRFNKSESAPEEQFGNITFVFKTRS